VEGKAAGQGSPYIEKSGGMRLCWLHMMNHMPGHMHDQMTDHVQVTYTNNEKKKKKRIMCTKRGDNKYLSMCNYKKSTDGVVKPDLAI